MRPRKPVDRPLGCVHKHWQRDGLLFGWMLIGSTSHPRDCGRRRRHLPRSGNYVSHENTQPNPTSRSQYSRTVLPQQAGACVLGSPYKIVGTRFTSIGNETEFFSDAYRVNEPPSRLWPPSAALTTLGQLYFPRKHPTELDVSKPILANGVPQQAGACVIGSP